MTEHDFHTVGARRRFERLLERFDNWLFATGDDARAADRGWQVSRVPKSRRRVYRDPRWDTVHACASCGGTGLHLLDETACPACAGIGVVRSTPAAAVAAGQPAGRTGGRP
jgi:hypothetical protein